MASLPRPSGQRIASLDVRVAPTSSKYRIGSWGSDAETRAALAQVLTCPWPERVGASGAAQGWRVLCVGPAEWVAIGGGPAPPMNDVEPIVIVNVSDGLAELILSGDIVHEVLSGLCALDMELASFPVDTCARTRLASLPVILDRRSRREFRCYLPRSNSHYALSVLLESGHGDLSASPTGVVQSRRELRS